MYFRIAHQGNWRADIAAGITTAEQLRQMGAIASYVAVKRTGTPVSLNLLWALEGALTGQSWKKVARLHWTSLLLALEEAEKTL